VRTLLEFVVGVALRRLLGRPQPQRPRTSAARRGRRGGASAPRSSAPETAVPHPASPPGRPRGALVGLMLAALAIGVVLMFLFEEWYTRLVGVLALFTFVVAGVFAIAGSGMLDGDG
jgi:hypothetical protein